MRFYFHFNFEFFIDFNDIVNRLKHIDLFFRFPKEKLWEKYDNNYKIIPVGAFCMPRILVTLNGLKPSKAEGEKTCVFDQAIFGNIERNAEFIENHFDKLIDGVELTENKSGGAKVFENKEFGVKFTFELSQTTDEFKKVCARRIENFYNYIKSKDEYIFFFLISGDYPTDKNIGNLMKALEKYREKGTFSLIVVNNNPKIAKFKMDDVYIINHYFSKKPLTFEWVKELKGLKTFQMKYLNNKITSNLIEIIEANKHKFPV